MNPEDFASAVRGLIQAAAELNDAVAEVRGFGLSISLSVNGHEYGDRVGVRIEGALVDAWVKPEAEA